MFLRKRLLIALVVVCLILVACGGGSSGGGGGAATQATGGGGGGEQPASPVDPATAATVTGKVIFTGDAPANDPILMDAEQVCKDKYTNGAATETVLVNADGTLQNVFVYVKAGLSSDLKFPVPTQGVVLDQEACRYQPHVLGVQVGQDVIIRNSDGILHNIHPVPTINRSFNIGQPKAMDTIKKFDKPEVMIRIECDIHDWMLGYAGVLDHPYFSVTGEAGTFSLPNLPPGTYTVEAWHEQYGTQTMEVTVGAKETKQVEFTFSGS